MLNESHRGELPLGAFDDEPYVEPWKGWKLVSAWILLMVFSWGLAIGFGFAMLRVLA